MMIPMRMWMIGWTILVVSFLQSSASQTKNETLGCRKDLGMYSGEIKDSEITASSSYDEKSVGPVNARIRTERNGGAWCPKKQITRDVYEWLQINLEDLHFISQVETQGRFGNGQGQEFAPSYLLEYQRFDGDQWIRYKDKKGVEVREGNSNTYLAELRDLNPPIIARAIRFVPFSNHPRTICMRVEIYGCKWADGITSYEMKQGDRRGGGELDFSDHTYDGHQNSTGYLTGGLGQLTDREVGSAQFRLDLQFIGKRGFEWVAWKKDDRSEDFVEIIFRFDAVRNFSEVRIHVNNMFSKEIGVFRLARIYFSVGGHYYNEMPVEYENLRNVLVEEAKYVQIPIPNRIGRHVRVQLFFDTRWIMISEVQLVSEIVVGWVPEEAEPVTVLTTAAPDIQTILLNRRLTTQKVLTSPNHESLSRQPQLTVIAPADTSKNKNTGSSTDTPSFAQTEKDSLVGILLGTFAALFVLSTLAAFILLVRYRRKKYNTPLKSMFIDDSVNFNLNHFTHGGKILNGNVYNSIASNDFMDSSKDTALCNTAHLLQSDVLPDNEGLYSTLPGNYNLESYSNSPRDETIPHGLPALQDNGWATATHIQCPISSCQGGSTVAPIYASSCRQFFNFSPEKLRFVQKLGDGKFGEVHICETSDLPIGLDQQFRLSQCCHQTSRGTVLAAVKMLHDRPTDNERRDFENEIQLLSCLVDPNLIQMLGICKTEKLSAIVCEYTALGNLRQFLSQRTLENSANRQATNFPLSHGCLIYLCTQIASGMKYLESINLVHRDLSSRNCLIGHRFVVKVVDFGTGRRLYPGDYHQMVGGDAPIPLRWMSWEAALLKKFSCKSDVWSFGVTVWEILTLAKCRPFAELTNEEVIDNLGHYYRSDHREVQLAQPLGCSKEIYDLMVECWRRDEARRPPFHEIHMFLSRKSVGYSPHLEQPNCCSAADYRITA